MNEKKFVVKDLNLRKKILKLGVTTPRGGGLAIYTPPLHRRTLKKFPGGTIVGMFPE
jgi:hypothetical protein